MGERGKEGRDRMSEQRVCAKARVREGRGDAGDCAYDRDRGKGEG